jgi:hypothetical protein
LACGDFNDNGKSDLAIGAPLENIGSTVDAGGISVLYGTSSTSGLTTNGNRFFSQQTSGVIGDVETNDRFGGALAAGDFNGDGYDDLAIGIPGEAIGPLTGAGAVAVLYGSASGLTASGDDFWHQDSTGIKGAAEVGDAFGSSLAACDVNDDGRDDLVIGSPGEAIGSKTGAGAVSLLLGSGAGLTHVGDQIWSQDSANVIGGAESGDNFGTSLSCGDFNGNGFMDIAIGTPGEDIGSKVDAGAVSMLPGTASGFTAAGDEFWSQDTSGVIGGSEAGDQFGYAVVADDFNADGKSDLAIGVPGEALGSVKGGAINVLYGGSGYLTASGDQFWHQDSAGPVWKMEGTAEDGDLWGKSLGSGDFDGDGDFDLLIGSPGEAVGSAAGAGIWHCIEANTGGLTIVHNKAYSQNTGTMTGTAEAGDAFGSSFG